MSDNEKNNTSASIPPDPSQETNVQEFTLIKKDGILNKITMVCSAVIIPMVLILVLFGAKPWYYLMVIPVNLSLFISTRNQIKSVKSEEMENKERGKVYVIR